MPSAWAACRSRPVTPATCESRTGVRTGPRGDRGSRLVAAQSLSPEALCPALPACRERRCRQARRGASEVGAGLLGRDGARYGAGAGQSPAEPVRRHGRARLASPAGGRATCGRTDPPGPAERSRGGRGRETWVTRRSSALGEVNGHRPTGPGHRTRVCVAFYYLADFPCSVTFPRAGTCPITTRPPVRPRSASLSKGESRRCSRLVGSAERGSQPLALLVPHTASCTVLGTLWRPRVLVKVVNNPVVGPA